LRDQDALKRVMDPRTGSEVVIKEFVIPAIDQMAEETARLANDADVLVSHPLTFCTPIVADARRVPWVGTILAPLSLFSQTDFPALPARPGLVRITRAWPWLRRALMRLVRRETGKWMGPLADLRARCGLPEGGNPLLEGQYSPHLNLALFSRVMASPQPDWPARIHTTGFVFYNGTATLSPELEAFLDAGPAPIVFTLGSSAVGAAGGFYHESAAAVARLGVRAVLLTGGFATNVPARVPDGVLLVERAPHQLLFPRASAVVHQGGAGTTGQALRAGCPMLVVPHGHDQPDNAFRVTNLGVARTIFPKRYTAARVAAALKRLLDDPGYRRRAQAVAVVVQQEGGADAAAEAIAAVA
jgi:UDP:flavonoid glycosyltransferase YjiC (YdhE family)